MSVRSLKILDLAELPVWEGLQARIKEVAALRLGLFGEDAQRVLAAPILPPVCQYVLSEPDRRERCEQFHGSIRAEVRRQRRTTCKTCPFGVEYMASPITGAGLWAGHWEGGYVVLPGPSVLPDASLDPPTWFSALAVTPHRTRGEIASALALLETLHAPLLEAVGHRERRRDQVAQLVGYELGRTLDDTRSLADAVARCLELLAQVLATPMGALFLRDPGTEELVAVAAVVPPDTPAPERLRPGTGVAGRVLATAAPLLVLDVRAEPDLLAALPPFDKARAFIAVPIRVDGVVTGVLELASYAPHAFDLDDLGLLARLAELVEGVLHHDTRADLADATRPPDELSRLLDAVWDPLAAGRDGR